MSTSGNSSAQVGMVVAPQPQATVAGRDILRAGGNAVDAAIATALAQGVVDPHMSGLGGFGTMNVFDPQRGACLIVDFPGRAGSRANPEVFASRVLGQVRGHAERYHVENSANQIGYESIVVPGTVAGLFEAHRLMGRLPWRVLFEPAIAMARDGIALAGEVHGTWAEPTENGHLGGLARIQATEASAQIFAPAGKLLAPGELLVQPDLAQTLEAIADGGAEEFYRGEIGRRIAADISDHGGLFTPSDLANYQVEVREPVKGTYRGWSISAPPPPSSGVQVIGLLNMFEQIDISAFLHGSFEHIDFVVRCMQASFQDRAKYLGDPRFTNVPVELLLDKGHAKKWTDRILAGHEVAIDRLPSYEPKTTTHVTTADGDGGLVSLTHTLGSASGVVTEGLGFTYNNCMYQFHPMPGNPNSIAPGKARISGISPTIAFDSSGAAIAVGAPGGTHIPTSVAHSLSNIIDFKMSAVEAVSAPRFHSESELLEIERRLAFEVEDELVARGHTLQTTAHSYERSMALAHLILKDSDGGLTGGADPRGGGGVSRS